MLSFLEVDLLTQVYIVHCPEYFSSYFAHTVPGLHVLLLYKLQKLPDKLDAPTDTILSPLSTLQLRGHPEKLQQWSCRVNAYAYS